MPDLLGWRYQVTLHIEDREHNTETHETMNCDELGEIHDFADSIVHTLVVNGVNRIVEHERRYV